MSGFNILPIIQDLLKNHPNNPVVCKLNPFISNTSWSNKTKNEVLNTIVNCLKSAHLVNDLAEQVSPLLLEFFTRLSHEESKIYLFIILSQLIGDFISATNFAYDSFSSNLFNSKKILLEANKNQLKIEFIKSCYVFLNFNVEFFSQNFDWSFITKFIYDKNILCRKLSIDIYSILLKLDCASHNVLIQLTNLPQSKDYMPELQRFELLKPKLLKFTKNAIQNEQTEIDSHKIDEVDFCENVINIYGVLLRKLETNTKTVDSNDFILISSIKSNLQSIALGVSLCKPILVEGPMGCGKSMIIRHLAKLTGRYNPPDIVTIQISDQVDTKYLLGTYVCSDVPGEFLFNLGPLLKAIRDGNWIILEDIDCASSDVISLIFSLIETKSPSSIPGCENKIEKFNSNFRIFFTRRLNDQSSIVSNFSLLNVLEKVCYKITLNNLNSSEIELLIIAKWPVLAPITSRIVNVYENLINSELGVQTKRQITLRDLVKWCQRLSKYFKLDSDEVSKHAFMDAIDCFIEFNHTLEHKTEKSYIFGTNLNISKSECVYLLVERTPKLCLTASHITVGRAVMDRIIAKNDQKLHKFAFTSQSLKLLEKLSVCVDNKEPVLLCGETGVGKTSCIQYLANVFGKDLTVINMNQQSDSVELFGGYKPVDLKFMFNTIKEDYIQLFTSSFDQSKNSVFLTKFAHVYCEQKWDTLLSIMTHVSSSALKKFSSDTELTKRWTLMEEKLSKLAKMVQNKNNLTFTFIEGALTNAVRTGQWVLLDEINLAEYETLQSLLALLENDGMFLLFEKSNEQSVKVHKDFRLFACMNPATDVGKRELPIGIQNRFTEFYINEVSDPIQLRTIVDTYIGFLVSPKIVENIVQFYIQVKMDAGNILKDINGYKPIYSLRNLCRALRVASSNPFNSVNRSLYDAFCLAFLTNLHPDSYDHVLHQIQSIIFVGVNISNLLKIKIEIPNAKDYVFIENYPIPMGTNELNTDDKYILTPTVCKNLKDICRIISAGKTFPILLQGETSVGKTSLINWLAKSTGNVCYRVNNHEHTDLQEYIGSYCSDERGQIVFKEGILIEAMRNGHWLILDELNLAPTEVLEALNRVLDDNREYFIPETQEVVKAHPRFLLFATQNPPGRYGGRKILSRAFRNRFIELNFCEIPPNELETILYRKCSLPTSYSKRMVSVLLELQRCRSKSDIFAGKYGLITLRDLFRWGNRYSKFCQHPESNVKFFDWNKFLAVQGYMLLAGRVRNNEEINLIKSILEKKFKCTISLDDIFYDKKQDKKDFFSQFETIVWTKAYKRLATLIEEAIKFEEPVLLVGETGCGKTTICQYFASCAQKSLKIVNCHMNTEGADFLGSLRPNRNLTNDSNAPLFEWVNGPLINAMVNGEYLLVDEISLADDSVLERLNSVLELERMIFLAENSKTPLIKAHPSFRYFATMNPGGDYGKKELSPALRDRFTEIWCPVYEDIEDIKQIIRFNLKITDSETLNIVCDIICDFVQWFDSYIFNSNHLTFSIRDILSWVNFINQTLFVNKCLNLHDAFINGAFLVFIDSIGASNTLKIHQNKDYMSIKKECESFIRNLSLKLPHENEPIVDLTTNKHFSIDSFYTEKGLSQSNRSVDYCCQSPGVRDNLKRIMRALQVDKPILLEGSPGVGKTSLVQALANLTDHSLIRINLSDQTDISDLFGCDLPIEGEDSAGKFAFRDGPLLTALKSDSTWILLDELNLASQTVLEGLNACLDHRGEIYITELNKTFHLDKTKNRIFASQNPFSMDGTRKGLPKSFLNRFTIAYFDDLKFEDFVYITHQLHPSIDLKLIHQMITVNDRICQAVKNDISFAKKGGPFEFNLRDLLRWADITQKNWNRFSRHAPEMFFDLIFTNKMRTKEDKRKMKMLCSEVFHYEKNSQDIAFYINQSMVQFGYSTLSRVNMCHSAEVDLSFVFQSNKEIIESIMKCVEMNWMAILIGPSGCGKSHLIKQLALICSQKLIVVAANSEMDTTDLVGGFEQKDFARDLKNLELEILNLCLELMQKDFERFTIISKYLSYYHQLKTLSIQNMNDYLSVKISILKQMLELFPVNKQAQLLQNRLENLSQLDHRKLNGSFEWIDSELVKSIENGNWLLIENGNLLNPSVLDRLNSLLETDGNLIINEKGSINGELTCIKPHKNFRMFITMNPQHGELSRAMRNRGIEINMLGDVDHDELNQIVSQFDLQVDSQIIESCQDYSIFFSFLLETISKSQHGFKQNITTSLPSNNSSFLSKPFFLNHIIKDHISYYALKDYHVLDFNTNSVNIDSTKLRLFLENSSFEDFNIRIAIFKSFNQNIELKNCDLFNRFEGEFVNLYDELNAMLHHDAFSLIKSIPVDPRENHLLWSIISSPDLYNENHLIWNIKLNRLHLILFWFDLKYKLHSISLNENSITELVQNCPAHLTSDQFKTLKSINEMVTLSLPLIIEKILNSPFGDEQMVSTRNILIWSYQLMSYFYKSNISNWNQFLIGQFFPAWFMWNEKMTKWSNNLVQKCQIDALLENCRSIFNTQIIQFDKRKYNLIEKMTINYFHFKSVNDVKTFSNVCDLLNLLHKNSNLLKDFQVVSKLFEDSVNILYSYNQWNHDLVSKEIESLKDLIKVNLIESNEVNDKTANEESLIDSTSIINSIVASKLYTAFADGSTDLNDVLLLIKNGSTQINPWFIFYTVALLNKQSRFTDLFSFFLKNLNQNQNVNSVLNQFKLSDSSVNDGFLDSIQNQFGGLSSECMPILSLTCFHLFQTERITIEQFFSKKFTLNYFKKFLITNYSTLKKDEVLSKIVACAKTFASHLIELKPNLETEINSLKKDLMLTSGEMNDVVNQCQYLIIVGYVISKSTLIDFPIDPVMRNQTKRTNLELESELICEEIDLRFKLNQQKYGFDTQVFHCTLFKQLKQRLDSNHKKVLNPKYGDHIRMVPAKYASLKTDIVQFCETILEWNRLKKLCSDLRFCLNSNCTNDVGHVISRCLNYHQSVTRFINHITTTYTEYNDLTSIFLVGTSFVLKGIQLLIYRLKSMYSTIEIFGHSEIRFTKQLFTMFYNFVNIYCPHEVGEFLLKNNCLNKFTSLSAKINIDEKHLITCLLKSVFMEIENSLLLGFDKHYLFKLYLNVVDVFVQWWKNIKQDEENEKLKNEALFHFKLEDEPTDSHIQLVFPSFESKYKDLMEDDLLFEDTKEQPKDAFELNINKDTLLFVIKSHMKLTKILHFKQSDSLVDFLKPYLVRYKLLSNIYKKTCGFIDLHLENVLLDGHILVNQYMLEMNQCEDIHERPINVYKESSMSQFRECYRIIQKMKAKITAELLPQFENHPVLVKLLKIIDRICQIEIDSSLSSLATGLELLLKTSDEWQLIAHRGISLVDHLNEITELLVEWRKLEIKCWSECLQMVFDRIEDKELIIWWFNFYINLESIDIYKDDQSRNQLINSVKKYFENSSLGQFHIRLNILQSFINQLKLNSDKTCPTTEYILIAFENLFNFYNSFSVKVSKAIELEKSPIEKEIKEFVKISKWNPNNFWSLKSSLNKSHRQLYGYMKKYEQILYKPANVVFGFDREQEGKLWKMSVNVQHSVYFYEKDFFEEMLDGQYQFIRGKQDFTKKSGRLCKKAMTSSSKKLVKDIKMLEDMNVELINALHQYSSLMPPTTKDLDKWKKAVGQIQNKKRRALWDLFKTMFRLGLSFRKGVIHYDSIDMNKWIGAIKPLCENVDCFDEDTRKNISSCNHYFYKCLWGYQKFDMSIGNRNPELTFDIIERIKGFTVELIRTVANRRNVVSNYLLDFETIFQRYSLMNEEYNADDGHILHFDSAKTITEKLKTLSMRLLSFTIRCNTLVENLDPRQISIEVLSMEPNSQTNTFDYNTDNFKTIITDIKVICNQLISDEPFFLSIRHLKMLKTIFEKLKNSLDSLSQLFDCWSCLKFSNSEHLIDFHSELTNISQNIEQLSLFYEDCSINSISHQSSLLCDALMKNLLVSIQKVYSHFCSKKLFTVEQPIGDSLDENLIKRMSLSKTLILFNSKKTIHLLSRFIHSINTSKKDCSKWNYYLMCSLCPILHQYITLFQHILCVAFGSLKSSNKFLHIILTLFNDLLSNGFCIPPEPSESDQKDLLKDLQNSGFGQGDTSGAQDVSDRLDCQDQLDDMAQDGEQNSAEDTSDVKNSENGIEMDDDFDGNEFNDDNQESEQKEDHGESENEDEDLDEKMGNVDGEDENDILDEELWGNDSGESDEEDLNGDEDVTGGKDNIDSEMVANEDNKNLDQNNNSTEPNDISDNENDDGINELKDSEMHEDYQNENPDKYKNLDSKEIENNEVELPEDMQLEMDSNDEQNESEVDEQDGDVSDVDNQSFEDGFEDVDNMNQVEKIEDQNQLEDTDEQNEEDSSNVPIDNKNNDENCEVPNQNVVPNKELDENIVSSNLEDNTVSNQNQKEMDSELGDSLMKSSQIDHDKFSSKVKEDTNGSTEQSEYEDRSMTKNNKKSRSLADEGEQNVKRQRLINSSEEMSNQIDKESKPSDALRHVDNADKANELAYDIADPEDAAKQINNVERGIDLVEEMQVDNSEQNVLEKSDEKNNAKKREDNLNSLENDNDMEISTEGDIVLTSTVPRQALSSFHNLDTLDWQRSYGTENIDSVIPLDDTKITDMPSMEMWKECMKNIDQLVYELCNQLQLVLEPTKCSKFKGDFKSGKRLNMRKVIAYIASDYRKDKIWLRRSKPSKRQYQIIIGVDDSFSMSDNRSKQMAFESLILLGKSLSIIESGALSVLSFGEDVRILHSFNEPFTDHTALKMFSKFQFSQQKTKITELVKCAISLFSNSRQSASKSSSNIYQLLLIVSDGRGIFSEGKETVLSVVRKLKELGIFSVFLILDNPEHKNSVLDIRIPVFGDDGKITIESYMEKFPFPFYVILQNINSLPTILGEALRQWFELITHENN